MQVRERLRLGTLCGIDQEDSPIAGPETPFDFEGKVGVPWTGQGWKKYRPDRTCIQIHAWKDRPIEKPGGIHRGRKTEANGEQDTKDKEAMQREQ